MDYEKPMRDLVKYVMYIFYEPQHIVFMNVLLENIVLTEEQACMKMKLLSREFNKITMRLKDDKLIKVEQKIKSKEEGKDTLQNVYFINFAEVRNVIKYKVSRMLETIENDSDKKDDVFMCVKCNKTYTLLEAQKTMQNYVFHCAICDSELVENTKEETLKWVSNKTFIEKMSHLIALLKKVDQLEIPHLDYFQLIEKKEVKQEKNKIEKGPYDVRNNLKSDTAFDKFIEKYDEDFINKEHKETGDTVIKHNKEEPRILLNGVYKTLDQLTECDIEKMTEEEYIEYYNLFEQQNK
ncbi:tfa1 [Ecytonucleospora hepatopenaei]|uniref:Tfa1 n=1 Tax=Ecytonucleospora hepatopenaei TaxID=646526 RepID=A0A1W0E755_9MICR|nr:tfa1 [Ecytonucleospora hepatopenaei]